MKKRIYMFIAMMFAVFCIASSAVHAESLDNLFLIPNVLQDFSASLAGNMETIAEDLPNATIPYRGSNTILV